MFFKKNILPVQFFCTFAALKGLVCPFGHYTLLIKASLAKGSFSMIQPEQVKTKRIVNSYGKKL